MQIYTKFYNRSPSRPCFFPTGCPRPRPSPGWGGRIKQAHPPSPTRGRSSRCNTLVLRTNADGERPQISLKKQNFPFLHDFAVGIVALFPSLRLWFFPTGCPPPRPSPSWGGGVKQAQKRPKNRKSPKA